MALISTLPNFFNAATPTANDFNDAAKAIGREIGAEYWDRSLPGYVQATGNLDSTNLVASPRLKNAQKAESFSHFSIPLYIPLAGATPVTGTETVNLVSRYFALPIIPPLGIAYTILGVHLSFGGDNAKGVVFSAARCEANGGAAAGFPRPVLTVFVNDSPSYSIVPGTLVETSGKVPDDPTHFPMNLPIGVSDTVTIDITQLVIAVASTQGTVTVSPGLDAELEVTVMCKTPHVRTGI
jgi:hypothetical protein